MSGSDWIGDNHRKDHRHAASAPTGLNDSGAEHRPTVAQGITQRRPYAVTDNSSNPRTPFPGPTAQLNLQPHPARGKNQAGSFAPVSQSASSGISGFQSQQAAALDASTDASNSRDIQASVTDISELSQNFPQLDISKGQASHAWTHERPSNHFNVPRGQLLHNTFSTQTSVQRSPQVRTTRGQVQQGPLYGGSSGQVSAVLTPKHSPPWQGTPKVQTTSSQSYSYLADKGSQAQQAVFTHGHITQSSHGRHREPSGAAQLHLSTSRSIPEGQTGFDALIGSNPLVHLSKPGTGPNSATSQQKTALPRRNSYATQTIGNNTSSYWDPTHVTSPPQQPCDEFRSREQQSSANTNDPTPIMSGECDGHEYRNPKQGGRRQSHSNARQPRSLCIEEGYSGPRSPGYTTSSKINMPPKQTQALNAPVNRFSVALPPTIAPRATQAPINEFKPDRLDPNEYKYLKYKTHKFFTVGRVFKMFLIENAGETSDRRSLGGSNFTMVAHGEFAHHQFRRFVVVQEVSNQFFCYCCPITTYGGQATTKKGVDKTAHAIVYSGHSPPLPLPGEEEMTKDPLRIELVSPDDKLDEKSRINLGREHVIDHNFKIQNIGMVDDRSMPKLIAYRQSVAEKQRRG